MKNVNKHPFLLVAFGVVLFVGLNHISSIFAWLGYIIDVMMPILLGFMIALILNVPMRGIERIIDKLHKKRKTEKEFHLKLKRAISFSITILCILAVLALVSFEVFPKIVDSVISIYYLVVDKWPTIIAFLEENGIDSAPIQEWFNNLDLQKIIGILSSDDFNILDIAFNVVGATLSKLISFLVSFIIGIYALLGKEGLCSKTRTMVTVYCSEKKAQRIFHITRLIDEKYAKFLTGQCVEACILGVLMFIVLTIFNVPYASMLAMLASLFAFVPYVGAFLSGFVGITLILIVSPSKALVYLIIYLVIQFVETQIIYPHVVGTSVGLNALWTIIAVFIGGEFLGLFGMVFFIPLVAVVVTLVNEHTEKKIQEEHTIEVVPKTE